MKGDDSAAEDKEGDGGGFRRSRWWIFNERERFVRFGCLGFSPLEHFPLSGVFHDHVRRGRHEYAGLAAKLEQAVDIALLMFVGLVDPLQLQAPWLQSGEVGRRRKLVNWARDRLELALFGGEALDHRRGGSGLAETGVGDSLAGGRGESCFAHLHDVNGVEGIACGIRGQRDEGGCWLTGSYKPIAWLVG